jgi:predicted RNase H-like HicB family nuclease
VSEIFKNNAITSVSKEDGKESKAYRLHVLVTRDEDVDNSYSAVALNLPGLGSCGETEEEAVNNVREAARGVLESYKDHGEEIPWEDSSTADIPRDAKQKWIVVDA